MAEEQVKTNKISVSSDSYSTLARGMMGLQQEFSDIPVEEAYKIFIGAGGYGAMLKEPFVQNRRVKAYDTLPEDVSKEDLVDMIKQPNNNELELRAVSSTLASTTKTYDLIMQTYQDLLTYDWYIHPTYTPVKVDIETQKRDLFLAEKITRSIDPKRMGHEIVGKCVQYGKAFYTPRVSADKSHNKVNYAFLQQLPEDWCKIVGFNNGPGKYTIAFNMMYFLEPGTDWRQFGDLFEPYIQIFSEVVESREKYVYSSVSKSFVINPDKFNQLKANKTIGNPEWYVVGNTYYYWVFLPADKVITFEISDRTTAVVPPNTGLMVSMLSIPNYEAAQMEIVLNPLTSIMTGEIPVYETKNIPNADPMAVSPSQRELFERFWYNMLYKNNTSGIGFYAAPFKNMKLQTVSDTVSNTDIATTAVADQIQKSGLAALIPSTNDPKVGVAQLSAMINAAYPKIIYRTFEKMMDAIFESLNLKTPLRFEMFGDIFSREGELEAAKAGMTLGILNDTLKYNAMNGLTILDDLAISDFVHATGILDKRIPLISTYSAKQSEAGLPPKGEHSADVINPEAQKILNPAGRPIEDGSESSQKTETRTIAKENMKSLKKLLRGR